MTASKRGRGGKVPLPTLSALLFGGLFLVYLDALFTFENVPSTPGMRFVPKISIEILLLLALLAGVQALGLRLSKLLRGVLTVLLFLLTLVRYVDTTAVGVLGREFDLYGDFPHVHRVLAMFLEAMTPSLGLLVGGVLGLIVGLVLLLNWIGLGALYRALDEKWVRVAVLGAAAIGLTAFVAFPGKLFAPTVTSVVARQIGSVIEGDVSRESLQSFELPPQHLESSLEKLHGANVILIFVESYGVTLIEDEPHYRVMKPRYEAMEKKLEDAGYSISSSQILSPTFGGGSWRAHATLLSGFEADSQHKYDALLASNRKTLVDVLKDRGYRAVAAEPGIKWYWPDGLFYDFDKIYDFDALDYQGPPMGWWKIPDQFTLYRIYENEIRDAKEPLFAKFSLIMTHIPYFPVPKYVPDWTKFDDGTAYSEGLKSVAHDAYRDLFELSTWYLGAVSYELDVLEGFLLNYVPENSLVIIVGDHQPPKLATHDNDSWAVPMHVLSRREDLVRAFDALGFAKGLVPLRPSSLRMSDFLESFLTIYDGGATD